MWGKCKYSLLRKPHLFINKFGFTHICKITSIDETGSCLHF